MKMPFGKYRGKELPDIPEDYLAWVLDKCSNASPTLREHIRMCLTSEGPYAPRTPAAKVDIDRWYKRLSLEFHPDCGGNHAAMKAVNRAREVLVEMVGSAR